MTENKPRGVSNGSEIRSRVSVRLLYDSSQNIFLWRVYAVMIATEQWFSELLLLCCTKRF